MRLATSASCSISGLRVGARSQIGAGPGHRLRPVERGDRGDDALHELRRSHRVGAGRQLRLRFAAVARLALHARRCD